MYDTAPPPGLDELFLSQAAATPKAPAIHFRGRLVSYGELASQVLALAGALAEQGVGPGVLVAVAMERRPEAIALILAVLAAGGAWLPLDRRYPRERLDFVLADSGAGLLVAGPGEEVAGSFAGPVLELSGDRLRTRRCGEARLPTAPAELAYMIYTSGSTGAPKGVMLGHGATHLVDWARRFYSPAQLARVAATSSLCFDPSIFEIFVPLCTGGAMVLKESALEPFAEDEAPSLMDVAPSVLAQLQRAGAVPPSLLGLNIGGEALSGQLVRAVQAAWPALPLYNHYGPTEATTCASVATLPPGLSGEPSIGVAVRGASLLLLDPTGEPVAEGETGDIHIGGPGLALGYWNRPDLTAQRFIHHPQGRLYRTGDLAFRRDGELYFSGRADRQVKVRGFRIELGEVETALQRLEGVEAAYAALGAGGRLVAHVQTQRGAAPLRSELAAWLPDYMIPARIIALPAFPLLPSGKLDHGALSRVADDPPSTGADHLAPAERAIIHVFQEVLGRRDVGRRDSFFELGGDSLSCVGAALRLGEVLGYELPAALICQAPSPRALARALEHARLRTGGHLSLLQAGGMGPPLFCTADLFGHVFNYLGLASALGAQRPVHGLSPGPLQARFARDGDLGALADAYLAELRGAAPHGPYLLAGYSAGGLLAAALASQLEAQGERVRLVLLDSALHSSRPPGALLGGLTGRLSRGMSRPPSWIPRSQVAFAARMIRAGLTHRPSPFHGPVLVVKARDADPVDRACDTDGLLGWSGVLRGEAAVVEVGGDHHQFLREPRVAETAEAVRAFLGRA